MKQHSKSFNELTLSELYAVLQARQDVFIIEQDCVYRDLDDLDQIATHLWYSDESTPVAAYCRVFEKTDEPNTMVIGRVITIQRGTGLGRKMLHEAVQLASQLNPHATQIWLEAQQYAIGFYEKEGFHVTSEPFMDEGIMHVEMRLPLTES